MKRANTEASTTSATGVRSDVKRLSPGSDRSRRSIVVAAIVVAAIVVVASAFFVVVGPTALASGSTLAAPSAPLVTLVESSMTAWKAALLGIIEGATEYLPISSTGHLLIASGLLGLGTSEADVKAVDTYAIAIQFGAILAVAGLFWKRFRDMVLGLLGRSDEGRHLLVILIVAFLPAAILGFVLDDMIQSALFSAWPIIGAWLVGGMLILVLERSGRIVRGSPADAAAPDVPSSASLDIADDPGSETPGQMAAGGRAGATAGHPDALMAITVRQAAIIGLIQCLAMWPGTSRSLATILGALLVGVGMAAAVEFSFLLGFVTLTAASVYALAKDGGTLVDQFGVVNPLVGLFFAFVSAVVAIKWMVTYLQRHDLSVFGWYRIVVAGLAAGLVISGALNF